MNEFDIINIRKIINYRNTYMDYSDKGEISPIELECKTTEELQKMINDYNENNINNAIKEIKKIVDKLFTLDKEANTIIVSQSYKDSFYRFEIFEINTSDHQSIKIDEYNKWCISLDESIVMDCYEDIDQLNDLIFDNDIIRTPEEIFAYDDSVNDIWFGVIGITRDYKLIKFVCEENSNNMTDIYENSPKILKEL